MVHIINISNHQREEFPYHACIQKIEKSFLTELLRCNNRPGEILYDNPMTTSAINAIQADFHQRSAGHSTRSRAGITSAIWVSLISGKDESTTRTGSLKHQFPARSLFPRPVRLDPRRHTGIEASSGVNWLFSVLPPGSARPAVYRRDAAP